MNDKEIKEVAGIGKKLMEECAIADGLKPCMVKYIYPGEKFNLLNVTRTLNASDENMRELSRRLQYLSGQCDVTVKHDLSPALVEGKLRDKLIELGYATPEMIAERDAEIERLKREKSRLRRLFIAKKEWFWNMIERFKGAELRADEIESVLSDLEDGQFRERRLWYCCKVGKRLLARAIRQAQQDKMKGFK